MLRRSRLLFLKMGPTEEVMLGRGSSRGGCRLSPSASIGDLDSTSFQTTPAEAGAAACPSLSKEGSKGAGPRHALLKIRSLGGGEGLRSLHQSESGRKVPGWVGFRSRRQRAA
jgi:hypothetical protein